MDFQREYAEIMEKLLTMYDDLRQNKEKPTRNNAKLAAYDKQVDLLSREIDRLREKYREQYEIYELIEGVQSTHKYIIEDITGLSQKPRPQNLIPNFGMNKPRRSSFSSFEGLQNRFKKFTQRRRKSFGGKRTRKH
jgi:predicted nuclease with TOPRIM domain